MSRSIISVSIILFDLHFRILKKISLPVVSCYFIICLQGKKRKKNVLQKNFAGRVWHYLLKILKYVSKIFVGDLILQDKEENFNLLLTFV